MFRHPQVLLHIYKKKCLPCRVNGVSDVLHLNISSCCNCVFNWCFGRCSRNLDKISTHRHHCYHAYSYHQYHTKNHKTNNKNNPYNICTRFLLWGRRHWLLMSLHVTNQTGGMCSTARGLHCAFCRAWLSLYAFQNLMCFWNTPTLPRNKKTKETADKYAEIEKMGSEGSSARPSNLCLSSLMARSYLTYQSKNLKPRCDIFTFCDFSACLKYERYFIATSEIHYGVIRMHIAIPPFTFTGLLCAL